MKKSKVEKELEYGRKIAEEITSDYLARREARSSLERQWRLNLNYVAGNQYCEISPTGEVTQEEKYYGWQSRSVFNHVAPIVDTRLAKLSRVRPAMSVRAVSSEEGDLKSAVVASDILRSTTQRIGLDKCIADATAWSEVCGTSFYKVGWDPSLGKVLGEKDGIPVYEGDVFIKVVSPFEIYPDSLFTSDIKDLKSIIHARAVSATELNATYGKNFEGEELDVFSLDKQGLSSGGNKKTSASLKDQIILIELYEKPSANYPNGRYVAVAGGELLEEGELPYINGVDGERGFPFIKQVSTVQVGAFFGVSLVERLIPLQRAYNAVKNRKYEFMNRVSMGVINVEDGSVDTDDLVDDGLSPGKVIVYRQGSRPPQMMNSGSVPLDFTYEEERLKAEFVTISGTSEVSKNSTVASSTMSGAAIELLIEQDETRLSVTAESIRSAVKDIGKHVIRLYRQFAKNTRIMRCIGEGKAVKLFYFNSADLSSDDIVFDTENELTQTPAQKKTAVLEMLSSGLLTDDSGRISSRTKIKILEILGYGSLSNAQDIITLHSQKAEKENLELMERDLPVDELDDHGVHVEEHLRKLLSLDNERLGASEYKTRIKKHVQEHKKLQFADNIANLEEQIKGE